MKPVRTGQLKHRVTVKRRKFTQGKYDELGNELWEEEIVGTYWALIESRTGSLLKGRTAETILTNTTHVIMMRYHPAIDHACWIEYQGHRFDIDYVGDPDFQKTWMQVYVREVVG